MASVYSIDKPCLKNNNMRCPNCGNQASWRDPDCNKCDATLHQKNCEGKSPDCKCHEINEQEWIKKKAPPS